MNDEYGCDPEVPLRPVSRISVVYNLKKAAGAGEPDDKYEEYDPLSTVESVAETIASFGFSVSLCEQDGDFFPRLRSQAPDFVANLAEGRGDARGREAQVPCILESESIPFWGSDGVSMAVALDKLLTGRTLSSEGIPVPLSSSLIFEEDLPVLTELFRQRSRYVVKPRYEGSSKGIFTDSVAHSPREAEDRIRRIWHRYGQPALLEEYLPGAEITVGVRQQPACDSRHDADFPRASQGGVPLLPGRKAQLPGTDSLRRPRVHTRPPAGTARPVRRRRLPGTGAPGHGQGGLPA